MEAFAPNIESENRQVAEGDLTDADNDLMGTRSLVQSLRVMAQQFTHEADDIELNMLYGMSQDILQIHETLSESQDEKALVLAVDEVFSQGDFLLRS